MGEKGFRVMSKVKELFEQGIAHYNAGDLDAFAADYAEDAVLAAPNGTVTGRQAIRDYWAREQVAYPDRHLDVQEVVEQGETVAAEYVWSGTNTGPTMLADGTALPPTGRRVELPILDLMHIRNSHITVHHECWDLMTAMIQLGLLPLDIAERVSATG